MSWPWTSPDELITHGVTVASLAQETPEVADDVRQATDPEVPLPLLERLVAHHDPRVREAAATNPRLRRSWAVKLASDREATVRSAAARHPRLAKAHLERATRAGSTPDLAGFGPLDERLRGDELERLAGTGYWGRVLAAWHPATPSRLLRELAMGSCMDAKRLVAGNRAAPEEVLVRLASGPDVRVRSIAARNPRLPTERLDVLQRLAGDADLVGAGEPDPSLGASDLRRVLQDDAYGSWIQDRIARHPNATPDVLERVRIVDGRVAATLVGRSDVPASRAEVAVLYLALHTDPDVRGAIADGGRLPYDLLEQLARAGSSRDLKRLESLDDRYYRARMRTLLDVLARVDEVDAPDAFWWLRALLARDPYTPDGALYELENDDATGYHEQADERFGTLWVEISPREMVAGNLGTPEDALRRLARNASASVREQVARNPSAPRDVLQDLALDTDAGVREAAVADRATACGCCGLELGKEPVDTPEGVRLFCSRCLESERGCPCLDEYRDCGPVMACYDCQKAAVHRVWRDYVSPSSAEDAFERYCDDCARDAFVWCVRCDQQELEERAEETPEGWVCPVCRSEDALRVDEDLSS